MKDGETITTNEKYVVQTNALLIRNVQESDDGTYSCRAAVISTGELDIRYIKVEVQIPPTIEPMQPLDIIEGDLASIQCNAIGKPPPVYTWIKRSTKQDLSKTDRFSVNPNTGLLVINKVEQDDHSEYQCLAKNSADEAIFTVRINVLIKPKIYDFTNITASVNKSARLICKVQGRPAPVVTFKKFGTQDYYTIGQQPDNDRIILEQRVDDSRDETIGIVTFTKLNRSDDGLYECMGDNKAGKSWKNGHLTVEFPPSFASSRNQPPVWSWNNQPGNLSCLAESIPNATLEWRLNDIVLQPENKHFRIFNKDAQSFLIVTPYDDKRYFTKYKCVATNKLGQAYHYVELKQAFVPKPVQQAKVISLSATTIEFDIVGPAVLDGLPVKAFVAQFREEREFNWNVARNMTWSVGKYEKLKCLFIYPSSPFFNFKSNFVYLTK